MTEAAINSTGATTTAGLFQLALDMIRSYPLEPPDVAPAFSILAGAIAARPAGRGPVTGLADDLWERAARIASGALTVAEVLAQADARRAQFDAEFGAYEYAAALSAEPYDREVRAGRLRGPLHGIPISVKDIIDVEEMPTRGSSAAMAPRWATHDAAAVARLRAAGAVITGKAVTHEFALGVTTPQSKNPWDTTRIPGGSSGGSAITVLTRMTDASLGTDTRASIRVPPALTGLVGYRPSHGVIPVDRWLTLSWSMDEFGLITRSVRDVALVADAIAGNQDFRETLPGSIEGLTFATSDALRAGMSPGVAARFEETLNALQRGGARVVRIEEPSADTLGLANMAGMIVSRVEAAQFHAEQGTALERCTPEVRQQLEAAAHVEGRDYLRALRLRSVLRSRITAAISGVDFLVMPTTKVTAPPREDADDYLLMLSETCIPWSLIGCCCVNIYAGQAEGLPSGLQLVGRPGDDRRLLAAAHGLEALLEPAPEWRSAQAE